MWRKRECYVAAVIQRCTDDPVKRVHATDSMRVNDPEKKQTFARPSDFSQKSPNDFSTGWLRKWPFHLSVCVLILNQMRNRSALGDSGCMCMVSETPCWHTQSGCKNSIEEGTGIPLSIEWACGLFWTQKLRGMIIHSKLKTRYFPTRVYLSLPLLPLLWAILMRNTFSCAFFMPEKEGQMLHPESLLQSPLPQPCLWIHSSCVDLRWNQSEESFEQRNPKDCNLETGRNWIGNAMHVSAGELHAGSESSETHQAQ